MAQQLENRALPDPVLVFPQREMSVIGRDVTLEWEPVAGAQAYVVQISRTPEFTDVVFEESAGGETRLRVHDVLPEDRETFYWRVFAQAGGVESPGEHIESFIVLTPSERQNAPQTEEEPKDSLGPAADLIKAAGAEAVVEATGSEAAAEQANNLGVEPEGVESAQILGLTLGIMVALALIIVLLFNWNTTVREQTLVQAVGFSGYPDLEEVESAAARSLNQYEVLSDAEGVYRVPIDRVITLMSNEARTARDTTLSEELPIFRGR